jgi:hypothetical protein
VVVERGVQGRIVDQLLEPARQRLRAQLQHPRDQLVGDGADEAQHQEHQDEADRDVDRGVLEHGAPLLARVRRLS